MCKKENEESDVDYIGYDLFGYEYNKKYPPNLNNKANKYDGYATPNEPTFFYDFCIQRYGVMFYYKNCKYEAMFTDEGPILKNYNTEEIQGPFEDPVDLMERSDFEGKKLIEIINDLGYVSLH